MRLLLWIIPVLVTGLLPNEIQSQEGIGESAKAADTLRFSVVDSQEVDLGERSVIYNRVEPPVLKARPAPEVARESAPVTAEMQEFIRRWESKRNVFLFVSATVYDHRVTEVRLPGGDGEYVLWSSIDFNHFRGLFEFETAETRYTFFLGIGDESSEVTER